ncbi:MAG: hypothetical protein AB7J35_08485 [Dehalococcoidia bacterium]
MGIHPNRIGRLALLALPVAFVIGLFGSDASVSAEPVLEVHPPRTHCAVPLMIEGSGLAANKTVSIEISFEGSTTGSVGGVSTSDDGRFSLPVPFALIEGCARDGLGTATLSLDGEPTGLNVDFEVAGPLAPPSPPASGNSLHAISGNETVILVGSALVVLASGLGWLSYRRPTRPTSD